MINSFFSMLNFRISHIRSFLFGGLDITICLSFKETEKLLNKYQNKFVKNKKTVIERESKSQQCCNPSFHLVKYTQFLDETKRTTCALGALFSSVRSIYTYFSIIHSSEVFMCLKIYSLKLKVFREERSNEGLSLPHTSRSWGQQKSSNVSPKKWKIEIYCMNISDI